MKNEIMAKGNHLVVNACEAIKFEEEIEQTVDMGNIVIVLTMPEHGYMTDNRIYGIMDGKIAWRVQDMLEYDPDLKPFMPNSYTYIEKYDKDAGLIIATTFQGFRFLINPHNGRIIGTESWIK